MTTEPAPRFTADLIRGFSHPFFKNRIEILRRHESGHFRDFFDRSFRRPEQVNRLKNTFIVDRLHDTFSGLRFILFH